MTHLQHIVLIGAMFLTLLGGAIAGLSFTLRHESFKFAKRVLLGFSVVLWGLSGGLIGYIW